ncbi:hypothetical protein F444_22852 [Phytophthora nicotianae P1976]|uniref:Uncharacterized protein n=1 Tax=Phytophthora nicotianae P1976 TaxID=1317066 RepID=A0A080YWK3_PHYNI|nr:hypothetical protein F444_22852 [Phytophthora nicotianae P1976]
MQSSDVADSQPGQQMMLTGDVNGAFRHIPIVAEDVGRFVGAFPELNVMVIDLYCPFGWKNSPASYCLAGAAIKHVYASSVTPSEQQPAVPREQFDARALLTLNLTLAPV